MPLKLSVEEIRMLADQERRMDSGELPFVNSPGGRMSVSPEVMAELGLAAGQTVSWPIMQAILEATLASLQAHMALDKAVQQ